MLKPEYLDYVGEELVELFSELETAIEVDIARRIARVKYGTATAQWQREKLGEVGEFRKFLEKSLREGMCQAEPELKKSLRNTVKVSITADNRKIKEAIGEVPIKAEGLNRIINAGYVQTRKSLKNFCNSMGNIASGELRKHLDMAYMEIKSGAFSVEQAIGNAVNCLAREGIRCIEYSNGKKISIEAGVRRAVISGINRTSCEATLGMAEELGVDLVKTTEHLGARAEHAIW
jgi:hypothetical protein